MLAQIHEIETVRAVNAAYGTTLTPEQVDALPMDQVAACIAYRRWQTTPPGKRPRETRD